MTQWPDHKKFAFSIVDDTDCTTLENGPILYDFLHQLGIKVTKTVWIFDGEVRDNNKQIIGTTCQDRRYLAWVQKLQDQGFEIGLHSVSWSTSPRERVIAALELFKSYFGNYPSVLAQHNDTIPNESLYWGANRLGGVGRAIYQGLMMLKGRKKNIYLGDVRDSEYFWGDVCQGKIKYVRNFVYPHINTLKDCPIMPYHDPLRPYVNYWFASTEGPDVTSFNAMLSEENQLQLEEEGGACIMYTHFGKNFVENGALNADFQRLMAVFASRDGWFVPVSQLLDHLLSINGHHIISKSQRAQLERRWLWHKLRVGTT